MTVKKMIRIRKKKEREVKREIDFKIVLKNRSF